MSKGLEALKKIKNDMIYQLQIKGECVVNDDFRIIEKELKDYENLKLKHRSMQDEVLNDFKKLKALEIIIEKNVDIVLLKTINDFTTYNELRIPNKCKEHICINDYMLNRENYYLLKEVLNYEINKEK